MGKTHIVTDTSCDLTQDMLDKFQISTVSLSIQFGEKVYADQKELSSEGFYELLAEDPNHPSTCQPSPADFVKVYEQIAEPGDSIISIHLSSQLSGTYQSAVLASDMVKGIDITVIDTKLASIGVGFVAMAAAAKLQEGASNEEVIAVAEQVSKESRVLFVVDTLKYLQKNGRIGKAQALVGNLLSIKPILTLVDGVVHPLEKARGKTKALKRISALAQEYKDSCGGRPMRLGVAHAACAEGATSLAAELEKELQPQETSVSLIGPTIGVHVGPGTLAVLLHPIDA